MATQSAAVAASPDTLPPDAKLGALVEPAAAIFAPELTVRDAVEKIRTIVKTTFVTYAYVTDPEGRLLGVVTMRDLLLAAPEKTLGEIMLANAFSLRADLPVMEAMKLTVNRHYPCYPVCEADGKLLGIVWGHRLFAAQAIEISMQAGSMVGVDKEERANTPWTTCLKFRHPWLQLNLVTAFVAAAVVGVFEGIIQQIVVLAVFLPVLAGQSGNTGCQALAVTLRGMTLGEFKAGNGKGLIAKEAALGLINGVLVGITAGAGMYFYAAMQKTAESPLALGAIVAVAMTIACVLSGICGVITPLALKKAGADPATASSIFLTTATDVVSMGCFLGLATWWLAV